MTLKTNNRIIRVLHGTLARSVPFCGHLVGGRGENSQRWTGVAWDHQFLVTGLQDHQSEERSSGAVQLCLASTIVQMAVVLASMSTGLFFFGWSAEGTILYVSQFCLGGSRWLVSMEFDFTP